MVISNNLEKKFGLNVQLHFKRLWWAKPPRPFGGPKVKLFISSVFTKAIFQIMVIGLEENLWWKFGLFSWSICHAVLKKRLKMKLTPFQNDSSRCSFVPISFVDPPEPPKRRYAIYGYQQIICHRALSKYITVLARGAFEISIHKTKPSQSDAEWGLLCCDPIFHSTVVVWS